MNFYFFIFLFLLNINFCFASDLKEKDFDTSVPIRSIPRKDTDIHGSEYKEDRGLDYYKYLSPSVKVTVPGGSGSGTVIYYDKKTNTAYVATCGHLWSPGVLTNEQAKIKKLKCAVTCWYKNKKKLDSPSKYDAEVLFYSFVDGCDTALISFKPDYEPEYFKLGSKNYNYIKGSKVHSMGCDEAREVAHYDMEIIGISGKNLIAKQNSPRPGRSGGGLVDNHEVYIGTCWGTTSSNGDGEGYFTPLSIIHNFWEKNGYGFLLLNKDAQSLRVFDSINQKFINDNEVLMPNLKF
jgi:hypothetical protein